MRRKRIRIRQLKHGDLPPKSLRILLGRKAPDPFHGGPKMNGEVQIEMAIANPLTMQGVAVTMTVDTGSWLTFAPQGVIDTLGLRQTGEKEGTDAYGVTSQIPVYGALLLVDGVARSEDIAERASDVGLLGYLALEAYGYIVDPIARVITPRGNTLGTFR